MSARGWAIGALLLIALGASGARRAGGGASADVVGDCDRSGTVAVNELITGVNIALGRAAVSMCPPFDVNASGTVSIDELVAGVGAALRGPAPSPTPTMTPMSGTPTATRSPTTTPRPIAPVYRQRRAAQEAAQQAALTTAADMSLLDLALGTAMLHPFTMLGRQVCPMGGQVVVECSVVGTQATRRIAYSACRTQAGGPDLTRDGVVTQSVADATFCARALAADDSATVTFAGYRQRERDGAGATVAEIGIDLRFTQSPTGHDGCAGLERDERLDGTLSLTCDARATSVACPAAGADLTLTLAELTLERRSSGAPCTGGVIASGRVSVDDRRRRDRFDTLLTQLVIGRRPAADESVTGDAVTIDGRMLVECLGDLLYETTAPVEVENGEVCGRGGDLSMRNAVGTGAGAAAQRRANELRLGGPRGVETPGQPTPPVSPTPVDATFRHRLLRAANGVVYQVLQNAGSDAGLGAETLRITTLVGAVSGSVGQCANSAGLTSRPQAVVGAEADESAEAPAVVVPIEQVRKSVLIRDATAPCFDRNARGGDGEVCVGPACTPDCSCPAGGACRTFSRSAGTLLAMASADVPEAELVPSLPGLERPCIGFEGRSAYRFGSGGPTTETDQCANAPADGFELPYGPSQFAAGEQGSTLIVAYDTPPLALFTAGAAGFPIDLRGGNEVGCSAPGQVLHSGRALADSVAAPSSRFTESGGVAQNFDGDGEVDALLPTCSRTPLRPCEAGVVPPPDQSLQCNAIPLGGVPVEGTTTGGENRVGRIGPNCGWGSGGDEAPEAIYTFTASTAGRYNVRVQGDGFDPLLAVRRQHCQGEPIACDYDESGAYRPSLGVMLGADEQISVIVDGEGRAQGNFELFVAPDRPNLAVRLVSPPSSGVAGAPIEVIAEVSNIGAGDAAAYTVEFRLFTGAGLDEPAGTQTAGCGFDELLAGRSEPCRPFTFLTLPLIREGTYLLGVRVRLLRQTDADESDNADLQPFNLFVQGVEIGHQLFRAADGSAYQVIRAVPTLGRTPQAAYRITSLGGSDDGFGDCNLTQGGPGGAAQAVAGVLQGLQVLHPYEQIVRSAILAPNDATTNFDPAFGGRLELGAGAGAMQICKDAQDCVESRRQPLFTLDSGEGAVPVACIANGVNAGCDLANLRNVFAFDLPFTGTPPRCINPGDVTINTTICAGEPEDGITLRAGDALVVLYDSSIAGLGFQAGFGVFGLARDGEGMPCAPGSVVSAQTFKDGSFAPELPTNTPTSTPTDTPSIVGPTHTRTNTPPPTLTATVTQTATETPINPAAEPISDELLVNSTMIGDQAEPDVAMAADGSFVVVWHKQGGIFAQRFDAGGARVGSEFRVNQTTAGALPAVAMAPDERFVVTWDTRGDGSPTMALRLYDASGNPLAEEREFGTSRPHSGVGVLGGPDVTMVSDSSFVVVWEGAGLFDFEIVGQRFDFSGLDGGPEFRVNTITLLDQQGPAIASAADGGFLVVWESLGEIFQSQEVLGQRYLPSGLPSGAEFRITADFQFIHNAAVALSPEGSALVAWHALTDVRLRAYNSSGATVGELEDLAAGFRPSVVSLGDRGFVVTADVASSDTSVIAARRYDHNAAPIGGDILVDTGAGQPSVAGVPSGRFVLTWVTDEGIRARIFRDAR